MQLPPGMPPPPLPPLPPDLAGDAALVPPMPDAGVMPMAPMVPPPPPFPSTDPMMIAQAVQQVFEQMRAADHAQLDAQGDEALLQAQQLVAGMVGGPSAPPPTDPMMGFGEGSGAPVDPSLGY